MTTTEPTQTKPRRSWPVRIARVLVATYLGLLLIVWFGQTWLIFPGSLRPAEHVQPPAGSETLSLTLPDGTSISGLFIPVDGAAGPAPTVIYFYGNGSSVARSGYEVNLFRRCGANVLLADYPGYGLSEGSPSER